MLTDLHYKNQSTETETLTSIKIFDINYKFKHFAEEPNKSLEVPDNEIHVYHYKNEAGEDTSREFLRLSDSNNNVRTCEIVHHYGDVTKDSLNKLLKSNEHIVEKFVLKLHAKEAEKSITLDNNIDDSSIPDILGIDAGHVTIVIAEAQEINFRVDHISLSHMDINGGQFNIIANQPDQNSAAKYGLKIYGNTVYSGEGINLLGSGYKIENCAVNFPSSSITFRASSLALLSYSEQSSAINETQELRSAGETYQTNDV